MEGHERNLEAKPREEEDQGHHLQRRTVDAGGHVAEIERPGRSVEERDAVEHQSAREQRAEDVFGPRLGRIAFVFVEGHQTGHRDRSQLQTDEEQQEVARADHKIHAQQRREGQDVEFALLVARVLAAQPRVGLQEDDQRPDGEHAFNDAVHRRMAEHAAEEFAPRSRNKVHNHLHDHQAADHGRKAAACALPGHEVVEEHEDENRREGHFGPHQRKYRGVIHSRLTQNMCNDLRDAAADHVAHPQRRQTHAGDGDDEADDRQPLVPRGVRKLQVLGIVARAVEDFPDDAQDVDRRDDD